MDIYKILSSIPHNHHHLKRYIKFIKDCKQKNIEIYSYTEHHHICPKGLFPEYISLSKNKWNGVYLTSRQHFIAHWMLWKAFPKSNQLFAFRAMCNGWTNENKKQKISSKIYEKLKIDFIAQISIRNSGENNPMYGKKHSEDTKQKMKKIRTGKKHSENTIKKLKTIKKPSGENNPMYGKKHSEDTKQKMSEKAKGRKFSNETKQKMSEAKRGKPLSDKHKQSLSISQSGENNGMYGKTHTEESKRKMSERRKGNPLSEEHKQKLSETNKGENNPMYGKKQETKTCIHCGKTVSSPNFSRWHGDRCKFKVQN